MPELFSPTFESLQKFRCPAWLADAKFGIWSHWGPQSVPMCGDWYARNIYIQGTEQYNDHLRRYGHPSKFGYKDLVKLWKAEAFDPDALMEKYWKAGARYFVAQAMHHDNFFNFPSEHNRFNSTKIGPMKDICGMWKRAADNFKLPFGLTEHLGASFWWWAANKGSDKTGPYAGVLYDGNDPEYKDFYFENSEHKESGWEWYTANAKFHAHWLAVIKELIDLYTPDLLYSDGGLPFINRLDDSSDLSLCKPGLEAVAHLYNKSIEKHGENRAVYTQKDHNPLVYKIGVLDIEKSQLPGIPEDLWQTDTCVGNWFYDSRATFKKPGHVIEMLIDIVSKNGVMLLNILQKPDGSIDDETDWLLEELAGWHEICQEAIHGTRPWRVFGEGPSSVAIDGFTEKEVGWTDSDYRFTLSEKLYAFVMKKPESGVCVIKSLAEQDKVKAVELLGAGPVEWSQSFGALTVRLPQKLPTAYANCLAITL
ncbi:MAG: alpha-L-fucosidase [Clostridiales bacterium]|jgi:alpha-L-fucosidase|nr:alpha-L-fucosidase [Clostridiales bacterium]